MGYGGGRVGTPALNFANNHPFYIVLLTKAFPVMSLLNLSTDNNYISMGYF